MNTISRLQMLFLQKVCFLLLLQLLLLLVVVMAVHKYFPKRLCLFTCKKWVDFILYMILAMFLLWLSSMPYFPVPVRYIAFFGISVLLAYIMALQYNLISILNHNDKKTEQTFLKALLIVVLVFGANLLILPFTLQYMGFVYAMSFALFICLIGLILWGFLVGKGFIPWVSVSLVVFLGFLITDLAIIVDRCKKQGSFQCDPINGATVLYVDLINILQQIFILLNNSGSK